MKDQLFKYTKEIKNVKIYRMFENCRKSIPPDFFDKLLENNMLENTKLYQELQNRESKYKAQIDKTYAYASKVLPKINRVFTNYTGHGIRLDMGGIAPNINIVGIDCGKCVINILNRDIFPNVARDNLTYAVREKVRLAVERAACQYIVNELTDDRELQMALQDYMNKNYPLDNPFYVMD